MTKADIVERIRTEIGCSKKEAVDKVETVFGIIKNAVETGEMIKISGFGNFIVMQKADRRGRNPHTGREMTISARKILTFKPSAVLRTAINQQPS